MIPCIVWTVWKDLSRTYVFKRSFMHAPPHFHALYSEFEALINIQTLEIYQGKLPRRALALVLEWAA